MISLIESKVIDTLLSRFNSERPNQGDIGYEFATWFRTIMANEDTKQDLVVAFGLQGSFFPDVKMRSLLWAQWKIRYQ